MVKVNIVFLVNLRHIESIKLLEKNIISSFTLEEE